MENYIGEYFKAADGGNYGIYIVGILLKVEDFVVMTTINGKIVYSEEPRRLDYFKASYRYKGIKYEINS